MSVKSFKMLRVLIVKKNKRGKGINLGSNEINISGSIESKTRDSRRLNDESMLSDEIIFSCAEDKKCMESI